MLTLRCMERWKRNVGDYDSAMILVSVAAITAERLTRCELDPSLDNLATPIPAVLLAPCNISSIASATGINRETARRKVNALIKAGYLERTAEGAITYAPGHLQQDYIGKLIGEQLQSLARTVNDLCKDGTLTCTDDRCASA